VRSLRREDSERFTEEIRGDEPELAKDTADRRARAVSAARRVECPAVGDTL